VSRRAGVDPLRIEVFQHLFAAVCEEMGATLLRSSFSANIKERRDFSCALFDGEGRMIGQAAHLPVHLGSTPMSVAAAIEAVPMGPGDTVILNDPYAGGTHLPDVTLVTPVFLTAGVRPDFYCANRAHHADVGGAHPGSMGPVADVHGEGLRIPPVRLTRSGEIDREVLALLLANMRVPREREGDLFAQWSANRLGERRLRALAEEHSAGELARRGTDLLDWTAALARAAVREIPAGPHRFEDVLEVPGPDGGEAARIRATLSRRGGRLIVDLRESDPEVDAPVNTVRAVAVSAALYVLRLLLPAGTPTNAGILRALDVRTRPGTLVDARYPRGVAAGNVETSQRLVDVLLGALAHALPDRVPAASAGTMSNLTFGGADPDRPAFAYYETLAGGAGGGPAGAGLSAVQTHMTNTRNTPIEALETHLPVRILRCTIRRGSGGRGAERGGDGVERRLRFLAPARLGWMSDRQRRGPWGLAGGGAGKPGRARVRLTPRSSERRLPGIASIELPAGAEVSIETPGGGGWGAPRGRRA
jgi:N-methylhydantoinase B